MMNTAIRLVAITALLAAAGAGLVPAWAQCGPNTNCPATLATALPACVPPVATPCTLPGMLTFTNQTTLSWPAAPLGCTAAYDVAVGDLGCLHGTCSFEYSGPTCFVGNTALQSAVHALLPAVGQGYYYVVAVDGETWNGSGPGECVNHDAIVIPVPTCP
jgi:hypothetical protein